MPHLHRIRPFKTSSVVVFIMAGRGHVNRMRPIIAGLANTGLTVHVFAPREFEEDIARAGGRFVDLFAGRPLDAADSTSSPLTARFVSFAGHYGDDVLREVEPLRPSLVIHDTIAVIGTVVANHLGLRRVNVCGGHNLAPGPTLKDKWREPPAITSERCLAAVRVLQERHGMPDASPFSFATNLSRDLNVYCEPRQFLLPDDRALFEPVAFFGSLSPDESMRPAPAPSLFEPDSAGKLRVYASFGTVIWNRHEDAAAGALEAFADAMAGRDDAVAVVSLGGRAPAGRTAGLARRNVRIEHYVDQWAVLGEASAFLTHHGLNSTHEAIFHEVPMISYPFFVDQPGLARRCQDLGLALPLVVDGPPHGPVEPADARRALARLIAAREPMRARLAEAREWELEAIHGRGAVLERMEGLMR